MTNPIRLLGLSLVMALSSAAAAQTTFEPNTDRRTGTDMPTIWWHRVPRFTARRDQRGAAATRRVLA